MSRWWPDRLCTPWSGGRAPAVSLCIADTHPAAIEQQLDALPPGTRLTCIVAGDGVRYQVVPWRDTLSRPAQRQLLAEQCFRVAYGDVARGWTVRQQATHHGAATLACAIDTALLDLIDAHSQARRLKLTSVQPALMHAYNQAQRGISPGLHWFVEVGAVSTTILLQSPTEPLLAKRLPSPGIDLAGVLDREWFALGMDVSRCPVYGVRAMPAGVLPAGSSWQVIDLTPAAGVDAPAPVAMPVEVVA